jgi:hypothetical protein
MSIARIPNYIHIAEHAHIVFCIAAIQIQGMHIAEHANIGYSRAAIDS